MGGPVAPPGGSAHSRSRYHYRENRRHRHGLRGTGHRHVLRRQRQRRHLRRQGRGQDRACSSGARSRSTSRAWPSWSSAITRTAACASPPTCPPPSASPSSSSSPWARRRATTAGPTCAASGRSATRSPGTSTRPRLIVIKSTVPVGTNAELERRMAEVTDVPFDVASNPEFLKEGAAIDDFMKPDRVVVGVRRAEVGERAPRALRAVPAHRAAVPGHVARERRDDQVRGQRLLATKISFINEMANLCERYERRHQRRPPRHRPRPAHRLQLPVPRRRLRRRLLPQGRPRASIHMAAAARRRRRG